MKKILKILLIVVKSIISPLLWYFGILFIFAWFFREGRMGFFVLFTIALTILCPLLLLGNSRKKTLISWYISLLFSLILMAFSPTIFPLVISYLIFSPIPLYTLMVIYDSLIKKGIPEKLRVILIEKSKYDILITIVKAVITAIVYFIGLECASYYVLSPVFDTITDIFIAIVLLACSLLLIYRSYIKTLFAWLVFAVFNSLVIVPLKFILPPVLRNIKLDYYLFLEIVNDIAVFTLFTFIYVSAITIIYKFIQHILRRR